MGAELIALMRDDAVFEVIANPDGKIWTDTFDRGRVDTGIVLDAGQIRQIIFDVAALSDSVISETFPLLEAEIPDSRLFDRSRFQGELPDVVPAPDFNIRKHPKKVLSLDDYVKQGTMTTRQKAIIMTAIQQKKNIIAAGGTKSGKTTLLNAILQEISKLPDRVILIEDAPELRCTAKDHVSLRTMPNVTMDHLLRATLRKTPDRIVVGEVRGGEALSLLDAWSTGHRGGCSTVHSNSAMDTLIRLENMTSRVARNPQQFTISRAVDIIVYLKYEHLKRRIEEIISVESYDYVTHQYITHTIE
ncbi:MAG: P-type conjugative transfer ATPase TrbB [Schwartzia sp.]|nr:P-type conjugative transfer ATPase TrbB [Schwartzia sp. (in: firmicutes)]